MISQSEREQEQNEDPYWMSPAPGSPGYQAYIDACAYLDWVSADFQFTKEQYSTNVFWDWCDHVTFLGYALPQEVWTEVRAIIDTHMQDEIEKAERKAGWDPNP